MLETFRDWTNDVLVFLFFSLRPSPRTDRFFRQLEYSIISTSERVGSSMPLALDVPTRYLVTLFLVYILPLIVISILYQLAVLVQTRFSYAMPDHDLIFYVDSDDDETDDETDDATDDQPDESDNDSDDDDDDDVPGFRPEPLLAVPPVRAPDMATESVPLPMSPSTPPSSPSSYRSSPPSSPTSTANSSFSSASSASSEKAPPTLTSAYLIKIIAMAMYIQAKGEILDTDEKRAEAYAYGLSIINLEETRERAYDASKARGGVKYQENDEVRYARMEARIQSHLENYILSRYPATQPSPIRLSFRPIQSSPKLDGFDPSTLSYPIIYRPEPDEDPFQSLSVLRAAAQRPSKAPRYHRSSAQASQSQISASHRADDVHYLHRTAVLVAAQQRASPECEASPVVASSTPEQELESIPDSRATSEPSPKRWADYDESDDDTFFAAPLVFGDELVVEAEQPAGPAAAPVKLLWSELVDSPDDDYFAIPPLFDDEDKVEPVVEVKQPAGPAAAPVKLLWSELVDLPDDDYFATPPVFDDESKFEVSIQAKQPASPPAPAPLRWSDLVDLPDDNDKYFASPPVF